MNLEFNNAIEDKRGDMIFMSFGKTKVNFFQTKKNSINGGHFHPYSVNRTILRGKIKYITKNLASNKEEILIISAPHVWTVQKNIVELIITLEDSIYTETYQGTYNAEVYSHFREMVEKQLSSFQ